MIIEKTKIQESIKELLIEYENSNMTLEQIGEIYGITRERVRQFYNEYLGRPKRLIIRSKYKKGICKFCGKEFEYLKNKNINFCSKKCKIDSFDKRNPIKNSKFLEEINKYGSITEFSKHYKEHSLGTIQNKWYRLKKYGLVEKKLIDKISSNRGRHLKGEL